MDSQNPNVFGVFDPAASSGYPRYNNSGNDRFTSANMGSRPRSSIADLPDSVLLRVLSHCDEELQLEAALVCRSWLRFSRKVYFASYTIQSSADYGLLRLLLQPSHSVHAVYVTRLDVSFTSDESTSGATGFRRPPPHVSASDVQQLVLRLVNLDSLRADWIGARGSSTLKVVTSSPVPSASIPSFLTIPRVLQRLRHLEIRGGSWPLDPLLQSLAYMPRLINLTMENIYEPTSVAMPLPSMAPSYQLIRLTIGRCTLSGETLTWLLSTSQHTLRHFTNNSLRRRPGSSSFNSALALVGPALETLRTRNCLELPRWDPESLLRIGLGYCPNLKTLVVWCDPPLSSPFPAGTGAGSSNIQQLSPSVATLDINQQILQSPLSPSSMSSSLPSPASQPPPGTMLPILMTIIQQEWLPNLTRLVIPAIQIESCLTRVECEAELLRRGITLGDTWG